MTRATEMVPATGARPSAWAFRHSSRTRGPRLNSRYELRQQRQSLPADERHDVAGPREREPHGRPVPDDALLLAASKQKRQAIAAAGSERVGVGQRDDVTGGLFGCALPAVGRADEGEVRVQRPVLPDHGGQHDVRRHGGQHTGQRDAEHCKR